MNGVTETVVWSLTIWWLGAAEPTKLKRFDLDSCLDAAEFAAVNRAAPVTGFVCQSSRGQVVMYACDPSVSAFVGACFPIRVQPEGTRL